MVSHYSKLDRGEVVGSPNEQAISFLKSTIKMCHQQLFQNFSVGGLICIEEIGLMTSRKGYGSETICTLKRQRIKPEGLLIPDCDLASYGYEHDVTFRKRSMRPQDHYFHQVSRFDADMIYT